MDLVGLGLLQLALVLAMELAGLLGGRLSFVRQPGEISVYSLMIPADGSAGAQAEPSAGRLRIDRTATADGAKHPGFVGRVLVAEDAKTNQLLIELLLRQRGLQVVTVEDGAQAVEKALAELQAHGEVVVDTLASGKKVVYLAGLFRAECGVSSPDVRVSESLISPLHISGLLPLSSLLGMTQSTLLAGTLSASTMLLLTVPVFALASGFSGRLL